MIENISVRSTLKQFSHKYVDRFHGGRAPSTHGGSVTYRGAHGSGEPFEVLNADGGSSVVLVCEHASRFIPPSFDNLGLSAEGARSHAAWDPGALAVAQALSERLDASLVAGTVSRLIYDCNRPPDSVDAMPDRSELIDVPANRQLRDSDRAARVRTYYLPFRAAVAERLAAIDTPVLITIHSFTPVYHGKRRSVEIGVLHDVDARLADALLHVAARHIGADVRRNQPYGPEDGVTHTLKEHAVPGGHLNAMLEIRSDLIETPAQQVAMADTLAASIAEAFDRTGAEGVVRCMA